MTAAISPRPAAPARNRVTLLRFYAAVPAVLSGIVALTVCLSLIAVVVVANNGTCITTFRIQAGIFRLCSLQTALCITSPSSEEQLLLVERFSVLQRTKLPRLPGDDADDKVV